jgi:hypothetical protein
MSIKRLFTEHPGSVDETYGEHFVHAMWFAGRMFVGSLACAVHAVLPFLFVRTGSRTIELLHDRMVANRRQMKQRTSGQAEASAS